MLGISCILTAVILARKKRWWDPQVGDKTTGLPNKNIIKIKGNKRKRVRKDVQKKGEAI